jgi:hypothetical protein
MAISEFKLWLGMFTGIIVLCEIFMFYIGYMYTIDSSAEIFKKSMKISIYTSIFMTGFLFLMYNF